jgi:predicted acetyltransferase
MSVEVRPIWTDDEFERHAFISHYAFMGDRSPEAVERRSHYYPREWCLGAFDGSELVAGLVIMPFEQYLNGAAIPMGGIASVSCLPERRRGGFVKALLVEALAKMRADGRPTSALYTPHYSLYRKYGWEIAGRTMTYAFPPKTTKPRLPAPDGRWRRIGADDWRELDAVYSAHYGARNGGLKRDEPRWRLHVFSDYGKGERDAAVWTNSAGEARAYAVYHITKKPSPTMPWPETTLRVDDWAALDSEGYAALLSYLLGHDLVNRILMLGGQDEPLADAVEEPVRFEEPPGAWLGQMLRLVDVQRSIEARPALPQASGQGVTLGLTDTSAPWNAGTWRIEASEGRMACERTNATAVAKMDVRALASMYNGFLKPADAVRTGSITSATNEAIEALTDLFAVRFSPYCADDF